MALTGKTASFPAISLVVTVLVAVATATYFLRPLVPPPPPNGLAGLPGEYLRMGVNQEVDWKPLGSAAFAEARRRDRPILLVIGSAWSRSARLTDRTLFSDQDVILSLRQDFVCIRVDATQMPAWAAAYMPLSRAQAGVEPSFQIHFLDPTGALIGSMFRRSPRWPYDPSAFRANVRRVREILATGSAEKPGDAQRMDIEPLVGQVRRSAPDFAAHRAWIDRQTGPHGGVAVNGFQFLRPSMWRFLLQIGDVDLLRRSLWPVLRTGVVDWLDGGFFAFAEYSDWHRVEFDKLAATNAEMAAVLAWAEHATGDPLVRRIRRDTMAALTGPFSPDRVAATFRQSDEEEGARSLRSSFAPSMLRARFSAEQRKWMASALGLDVARNEQMNVRVENPDFLRDRRFDASLDSLRRARRDVQPQYGGTRLLDAAGHTLARLFEAARWSGETEWDPDLLRMYEALRSFRAGPDDVVHAVGSGVTAEPTLADYLAYADASLGCFLAGGRQEAFEDGLAVLRRALFLFSGKDPAIVVNARFGDVAPSLRGIEAPQVMDDWRESTSAALVRLLDAYGRLGGDEALVERARSIAAHLAWTANGVQLGTSGLFASAHAHQRGTFAVASGPNRVALARKLSARLPGWLVAPAAGSVGRSLAGDGIHVFTRGGWRGPMDVPTAALTLLSPGG